MTPLYKRSDVLACIQYALWWKIIKSCQITWLSGFRVTFGVHVAQVLLTFKEKRNIPNAKSSWNLSHVSRSDLTALHAMFTFDGMRKYTYSFVLLLHISYYPRYFRRYIWRSWYLTKRLLRTLWCLLSHEKAVKLNWSAYQLIYCWINLLINDEKSKMASRGHC